MDPVIGIIGGKGKMGHLFSTFFQERGIKVLISDKNTKLTNIDLAKKSDIVIVSVPIEITEKVIKEVLPYIKENGAIMDLTSIKEKSVNAMLKGDCEVLGMHPMFGNTNAIPGQTVILCNTKKSNKWASWMEDFLKKHKVKIQKLSASEHDKIMNIAQGLVHFAEIVFADAIRRMKMPVKELLKFTGKASELKIQLAARLIAQDASLYGNIQIQNPQALNSLKEFKKSVDSLIEMVEKKDLNGFKKYFEKDKKFFGNYAKESYEDSSYLIDKLLELQKTRTTKIKNISPKKTDVAVLGPANTFSDLVADKYLKNTNRKLNKYFTKDIDEISDLVESGKVALGIAPIENKLNGTIRETLDALFFKKIHIIDEVNIQIHHSLIVAPDAKKNDIKKIISHPQALRQCKNYLKKNFPKAVLESSASTVSAVMALANSRDKSVAVIAQEEAGKANELRILDKNIEDDEDNSTTFIVIKKGLFWSKKRTPRTNKNSKTSIAFYFNKNSPGSLYTVFKDFADEKINLSKIESRPTKSHFGEYIFYLDFDGDISDKKIQKVLGLVGKKVAKLKILGSY